LDVSGSCAGLADRFWKAAMSLPEDRFGTKLFCFNTEVFEVDMEKPRLKKGGGTYFSILENYIQDRMKEDTKMEYPDAVFVITDGYGDVIEPQEPTRWYWFLSRLYQDCIPIESNIFMLEDFE